MKTLSISNEGSELLRLMGIALGCSTDEMLCRAIQAGLTIAAQEILADRTAAPHIREAAKNFMGAPRIHNPKPPLVGIG